MKRLFKKSQKLVKGMPSAVLLSFVIHAALLLLAASLVVFSVAKKEDKKFVPPKPVERPKMQLRKPKVKVKKTSKPKPSTRIVTKVQRANMPNLQLPEMSGMQEGLAGGIGGFELMPDLDQISVFGSGQTIGNDFVGTFYDLKRDRRGRTIIMEPDKFTQELKEFVNSGWKTSELARYYRSPKKLYATMFMVPPILSSVAPSAFDEADTLGYCWMAHYKGQLVHKDGITFRFRGQGDDILFVRVNGKIVLSTRPDMNTWQSDSADSEKYHLGHWRAIVGDWITLEPGVPQDMEVMFSEVPGGWFYAMLVVEEKGVEYPRNWEGGPILPVFKTAEPSLDLVEAIHGDLVIDEACVTNGPVFRDFDPRPLAVTSNAQELVAAPAVAVEPDRPVDDGMRTWTEADGSTFEGRFSILMGDTVVFKDARGKPVKVPYGRLSEEDRQSIELEMPPTFKIDFSQQSSQRILEMSPYNESPPPKLLDYVFGVKLRQTSARVYNHELKVQFFAIGAEIDGDNFILLDRQESAFTPSAENQQSLAFHGGSVTLTDYEHISAVRRGQKYSGYLVVVTDERGKVIIHETSNEWLFPILANLRQLPVGKHFDKTGTRVGPPRLEKNYY